MKRKIFSEKLEKAVNMAAKYHDNQYRKNKKLLPYISHCYNVALILQRAGFSDDVIIAGILHDTVEDTNLTLDVIKKEFGKNVADMIRKLTNKEGLSYKERKIEQISIFKNAPENVKAIKSADILHNVYSKISAIKEGENIWEKFDHTKEEYILGTKEVIKALRHNWKHNLLREINYYLEILEKL